MDNLSLNVKYRTDLSKSATKTIRRNNGATGTIYGRGATSLPVEVCLSDLVTLYKASQDTGASIIDLKVTDAPDNVDGMVVLKNITKNPISRRVIDVELQRISMTEKVTVDVVVRFEGEVPGVEQGGIVDEVTTELRVRALPGLLPPFIEVDISGLELGQHLSVSDLILPEGVEVLNDPDTTLIGCVHPQRAASVEEVEEESAEEGTTEAETTEE